MLASLLSALTAGVRYRNNQHSPYVATEEDITPTAFSFTERQSDAISARDHALEVRVYQKASVSSVLPKPLFAALMPAGGESLSFLLKKDCWQPPGWKADLERSGTRLHGEGSEQPPATRGTPQAQTSSLLGAHLFARGSHYHLFVLLCRGALRTSRESPREPQCVTSTSLWL